MRQLKLIIAALFLISPFAANADPIASRGDLQTILGGSGTVEDFEAFVASTGVNTDCSILTSSSICNGQGPGLVDANLAISTDGILQYDPVGYFGATSTELLSNQSSLITVDFLSAVGAFGLDLRGFTGFGDTAIMNIFATDDSTLLGTIAGIGLGTDGVTVFAGWDDAAGIGSFTLDGIQSWSPIIDNIEWGGSAVGDDDSSDDAVSVPEPGTLALLGLGLFGMGLARRNKKV